MKKQLSIHESQILHKNAPNLFGIFLEDINFTLDGGLNANKLNNYSFDSFYPPKGSSMFGDLLFKEHLRPVYDRLRFWEITGSVQSSNDGPMFKDGYFARVSGSAVLKNKGHNGGGKYKNRPAISIDAGKRYAFSGLIRSIDFAGSVCVWVEDENGKLITDKQELSFSSAWEKQTAILTGIADAYGTFVIATSGTGTIDLDQLSIMEDDHWGKGDPRYDIGGKFRRDLVEMLRDMHPKFMRFPGGGLVSGLHKDTAYEWKNTIGPLGERKGMINSAWGLSQCGYFQSYQIGFYELLCLCEDLDVEPIPVLWIGMTGRGQFITHKGLDLDSQEYQERIIQNYLDFIEFANGDPAVSEWARKRVEMGHPEPFNVRYIGVGNENTGEYYTKSFIKIYNAVKEKYPDMILIMSTGSFYDSKSCHKQWQAAIDHNLDCLMDGHTYSAPQWFRNNTHIFDKNDRNGQHLFLGEYAAGNSYSGNCKRPNSYESALAEAAFMTGIERNSDFVDLACYAPLFNMIGGTQWRHNLIDFNQRTAVHSTNYLVQRMYGNAVGEYVYKTSFTDEDGVYVSVSGDDKMKYVKLVNTSENTVEMEISLDTPITGNIGAEFIQCDDPAATNTIGFDGDPSEPVKIQHTTVTANDGKFTLAMPKYSFYVLKVVI